MPPSASRQSEVAEPRLRPRVRFCDFSKLEAVLAREGHVAWNDEVGGKGSTGLRRRVLDVEREVAPIRADVQDAARAVLTWLAAVSDAAGSTDLNAVVSRCLKPGPDVLRVDYAALAREIADHTGHELSPKRVKTAIRHLRHAHDTDHNGSMSNQSPAVNVIDELQHVECLTPGDDASVDLAVRVLREVRQAVGRLIPYDYTESADRSVDTAALRGLFALDAKASATTLRAAAMPVRVALEHHDATIAADMQLVLAGVNLVTELAGPSSLPGVMAKLNRAVGGRDLVSHSAYVGVMLDLADEADALHQDAETERLLRRLGRDDERLRLPRPRRLASFALNNAATRIIHRTFTGDIAGLECLQLAESFIERMERSDSGFELLPGTRAMLLTVRANHPDQASERSERASEKLHDWLRQRGERRCREMLETLSKHESCRLLVDAVRRETQSVWPGVSESLIVL